MFAKGMIPVENLWKKTESPISGLKSEKSKKSSESELSQDILSKDILRKDILSKDQGGIITLILASRMQRSLEPQAKFSAEVVQNN